MDLEEFKYGGANITAFRLVNLHSEMVTEVMQDWSREQENTGLSPLENSRGFRVSIETEVELEPTISTGTE